MKQEVRVRYAPSPTGPQHIGGIRTACYGYLFAKKHNGKFLLRIEDTDQSRFVPGSEEYLTEALEWLGLTPDESPQIGGPCGPYRQSERKPLYREYVDRLVEEGKAYYAFDTPEELDAMRQRMKAAKVAAPQYNIVSREMMKNSLTLPQEEVKTKIEAGVPYVIRIKVPPQKTIKIFDLIRGWVSVESNTLDDKVLMKSDGMPTYHLANVVDDHLMEISHVIRGEEWLPSVPIHSLLYEFFGWESPQWAHLPLLLKPEGTGKLSKRDADTHGFPLFPLDWENPETHEISPGFREAGYLPNAFLNFLAFLGWNPGTQQEIFSKEELIQAFSIERIGKAGVKFNIDKAKWYNQQYLQAQPIQTLITYLVEDLKKHNITFEENSLEDICQLLKERIVFPKDLWEQGKYFFIPPTAYDEKTKQKKWNDESAPFLKRFVEEVEKVFDFSPVEIKKAFMEALGSHKMGQMMPLLRIALTGQSSGADLMETLRILGKEEALSRVNTAIVRWEKNS